MNGLLLSLSLFPLYIVQMNKENICDTNSLLLMLSSRLQWKRAIYYITLIEI